MIQPGHHDPRTRKPDSHPRTSRRRGRCSLPEAAVAPPCASRGRRQGAVDSPLSFRTRAQPSPLQGIQGLTRAVIQEQPNKKKLLLVEGQGLREVMITDGEQSHVFLPPFSSFSLVLAPRCCWKGHDVEPCHGGREGAGYRGRAALHVRPCLSSLAGPGLHY